MPRILSISFLLAAAVTLPAQTYTTLFSFPCSGSEGAAPNTPPIQDTNGVLYGTTYLGGNVSGPATSITATTGAINQTGGIITATTLTGSSGGATSLDDANAVGTLQNFTGGTRLSFTNASALTATGVTATAG